MSEAVKSELRENLVSILKDSEQYFHEAETALNNAQIVLEQSNSGFFIGYHNATHFWHHLPEDLQSRANLLISKLLSTCAQIGELTRASALTGTEDLQEIKIASKSMRAALKLRDYNFRQADVIHDEGRVLGFRQAEQTEDEGLIPSKAHQIFTKQFSILSAILKLIEAGTPTSLNEHTNNLAGAAKYRADTAFIMMWMDNNQPELTDVADTVRTVFRTFGVRAQRADDIEHEGLITERVLNEIRTSEFLFADLTGARPNVYYEIGYAHALGKRVILFRKSGTGLHFDLAGYNCPEYENQRDLREKLTSRLISLTNRNPNFNDAI